MNNLQRKSDYPASPAERLSLAQRARQCTNWLKANGLEVIGIQKGLDKPRVFIKNSPLCEKLEGAVHRFERLGNVERRYWFAIRFGCEVRWNDEEVG